ncbi:hypothetical protein GQ600_27063 [Phytophthora cactorum]|nr:hypothetical protein GQ600_27063 [Phytophthora cactorum]
MVSKDKRKGAAMNMSLSTKYLKNEATTGSSLLVYREYLRLNLSCMITEMLYLQDSYKGVGVINPSFYNLINLTGAHWVAYHINRVTHVCCTFDPMQGSATSITKALREVVERLLHLDLGLSYEAVTWCKKKKAERW